MDVEQAERLIEEILSGHCVKVSDHCRASMKERGVTYDDLLAVLVVGRVKETRQNTQSKEFVVTIEGKDSAGDPLIMQAVILESERRVLCITVY